MKIALPGSSMVVGFDSALIVSCQGSRVQEVSFLGRYPIADTEPGSWELQHIAKAYRIDGKAKYCIHLLF